MSKTIDNRVPKWNSGPVLLIQLNHGPHNASAFYKRLAANGLVFGRGFDNRSIGNLHYLEGPIRQPAGDFTVKLLIARHDKGVCDRQRLINLHRPASIAIDSGGRQGVIRVTRFEQHDGRARNTTT